MPTASVVANEDPVIWVSEGIVYALKAQGLTVERTEYATPSVPTITGRLVRASGGMYMSMDANVVADLEIQHQGQSVANVTCSGQAKRTAWTVSANEYQAVFEAAMTDFINKCGPQLFRVLTGDHLGP
jgi:hypothetical protein